MTMDVCISNNGEFIFPTLAVSVARRDFDKKIVYVVFGIVLFLWRFELFVYVQRKFG